MTPEDVFFGLLLGKRFDLLEVYEKLPLHERERLGRLAVIKRINQLREQRAARLPVLAPPFPAVPDTWPPQAEPSDY